MALIDEGGVLEQLYEMGRARNLEEFKTALDHNALVNQNLLYADREGNIYYVYNGLMPNRPDGFDWSKPVDGSDPKTTWSEIHSLKDRPQFLNPQCGYLQNCNSSPFQVTDGEQLEPSRFPGYMVGKQDQDNRRAKEARRILTSKKKFTFDEWRQLPFGRKLPLEDIVKPFLNGISFPLEDESEYAQACQELREWNYQTGVESVATTLAVLCFEQARDQAITEDSLRKVLNKLKEDFGTWKVGWGEINRLQRSAEGKYDDSRESLPVIGTGTGGAFVFLSRQQPGTAKRYGFHGHAFVCAVEFGGKPQAASIIPFGQSSDPDSVHFFDQAKLYATGQMKPVIRDRANAFKNASRVYHPGKEKR